MVNKILNAITKQLGTTFGSSYKYYVENVKQGMTKPCFTIDVLEPRERSRSPILYDRTMPIVIHYFNDDESTVKKDSYAIAEQLKEALEYLPFEGSFLRSENVSWQMVENVLQLFVTYKFVTRKVTEDEIGMYDLGYENKTIN